MTPAERTASEWFKEATRCYVERHQGCAWCGGSHRVYQQLRGSQHTYYCLVCDFRIGYDEAAESYFFVPGEERTGVGQDTMYQP